MGADERLNHAALMDLGVPIVGKAFEIVQHYPTVVIKCGCEQQSILVLVGTMNPEVCRACGHAFAIGKSGPIEVGLVRLGERQA